MRAGLDAGADEDLTMPFELDELLAPNVGDESGQLAERAVKVRSGGTLDIPVSNIHQENHPMVRSIKRTLIPAALVAAAAFAPLAAQQGPTPKYKRDLPAKLLAQAMVKEVDAAKVAQAKFPNAHIQAVELENEDGRLIYSYELKTAGKAGIEEVNVNAKTGEVVNTEHEGSKAESKETKQVKAVKRPGGETNR